MPRADKHQERSAENGTPVFIQKSGRADFRKFIDQSRRDQDYRSIDTWIRCIGEDALLWIAYSELYKRKKERLVWASLFVYPSQAVLRIDAPVEHRMVEPEFESAIQEVVEELLAEAIPVILRRWPVEAQSAPYDDRPFIELSYELSDKHAKATMKFYPLDKHAIRRNRSKMRKELSRRTFDWIRVVFMSLRSGLQPSNHSNVPRTLARLKGPFGVLERIVPN